jgi:hypothetical protein
MAVAIDSTIGNISNDTFRDIFGLMLIALLVKYFSMIV